MAETNDKPAPVIHPGPSKETWDEALLRSGINPGDVAEYNITDEAPELAAVIAALTAVRDAARQQPGYSTCALLRMTAALSLLQGDVTAAEQALAASRIPDAAWDAARHGTAEG